MSEEAAAFTSLRYADVGTAVPSIAGTTPPVTWPSSPGAAANEIQTATITGSPTGGTFTLSYGGQTTSAIPYDALAAEVENALESLSSIGEGNVAVTGSAGGPWDVEFRDDLGNRDVALMTADGSSLTGGTSPDVDVTVDTAGSDGGGIWTPTPNVDPEKNVTIGWDALVRQIRGPGGGRPKRGYVIRVSVKSIGFQLTESGITALQFAFPCLNYDAGTKKLTLKATSQELTYKALALETPAGILELKKCAPQMSDDLVIPNDDLTMPVVMFETYEDDNGDVGFFHFF